MNSAGKTKVFPKAAVVAASVVAVAILFGAGGYVVKKKIRSPAWNLSSPAPSAISSPTLFPAAPPVSSLRSIVSPDRSVEATLASLTANDLLKTLNEASLGPYVVGEFREVSLQISGRKPNGREIFPLLWEGAPTAILDVLTDDFLLWLYSSGGGNMHLGVMFKLLPGTSERIIAALREWEVYLPQAASIFVSYWGEPISERLNDFKDGELEGVPVRFANFASGFAIDYAVVDDIFLFTTSKDSMTEAIKRIKN
jgi:hypothetical protein